MSEKGKLERFRPTFENGGFWEYYKDLERQFENYLEYVPYLKGNRSSYSYRLASLILSTGAHIDSAFKEMAQYSNFPNAYPELAKRVKKGKATIEDYFSLAEHYGLSERKVIFKCVPERITLTPFKDYTKKGKGVVTPDWWRAYNKVKHEFRDNFQKATLQNARDALAGAFLIHVCHIPSAVRLCEYGVLQGQLRKGESGSRVTRTFELLPVLVKESLEKDGTYLGFVETPLFLFNGWEGMNVLNE